MGGTNVRTCALSSSCWEYDVFAWLKMFDSLFGKRKAESPNSIRETLFGDMPLNQWPRDGVSSDMFPWSLFSLARSHLRDGNQVNAVACWRKVLQHDGLESRHYLQAWHFLRQHGEQPPPDESGQVLGVVVEVGMPEGLDLLAAYHDHSARYYNYSGSGVVWEHLDSSLDPAIDAILEASRHVVAQIGPWEDARPAPPPRDVARLSFLTPSGLHFGEGPMTALARDPFGGRPFLLATMLLRALVAKRDAG